MRCERGETGCAPPPALRLRLLLVLVWWGQALLPTCSYQLFPSMSSSDDEKSEVDPELLLSELSADTMAALQRHLDSRNQTDSDSDSDDEESAAAQGAGVSEDFGMSQFWYDAETSRRLGQEALNHAKGGVIAIISAPSAYKKLLDLEPNRTDAYCFEYDPRFACFGDAFVKYDFHEPERIPAKLLGRCDYIMVDPPYLNPDAVAKYSRTIRLLARFETFAI